MIDFDSLLVTTATSTFGAPVLWSRGGGAENAINGIFERFHLEIGLNDRGAPITANRAQVFVGLGGLPGGAVPQHGDRIRVAMLGNRQVDASDLPDGAVIEAFSVSDVQRDGIGGALLLLTVAT